MATANEHVLVSNPDKLVLFAEISGMDSCDREPTVLLRLVVQLCSGYGAGLEDVDTMEDLICRVPLRGLGCQGTAERAFGELVASINNPMLRPEVTAAAKAAAARVRARCGDSAAVDELSSTGFLLRVMFIDAWDESSDGEFGEFARSGMFIGMWEDDDEVQDDDDDGSGVHFSVRQYNGGFARDGGGSSDFCNF
ncbi:hypothetical protein BRADI_1g62191v3 [Brachypodium distachyon]|uniref:Uncharacterized protein n=1 Tax=Brachypodium distachyon TaxID=15368 RepID=A0A0Q3KB71_BRADI|nr:hypothetical protein BRADI_1g62191v3 [Brachypodium distachyon]